MIPTLVLALKDDNPSIRSSAAWALSDLGPKTPPEVIDSLVARLGDANTDQGSTFSRIGEPAVPALIKALKSGDVKIQTAAASALGHIGGRARMALPALRELAQGKPGPLAIEASTAAACISLDAKDATALFDALADVDPKVRREAVGKLRLIDSLAAAQQPALIRLLKDDDADVRSGAIQAIGFLGQDAPEAVAALAKSLPPAEKWGQALNGYGKPLGPTFKPAVPALRKALSDPSQDVRDTACRLLTQIGPEAKDAVPELVELLTQKREAWRVSVVFAALGAIGPEAKEAIPVLLTTPLPMAGTIRCLGEIGSAAKEAVPALRKLLMDPDPDIRLLAAFALCRIEGDVSKYQTTISRAMLPPPGGYAGGQILAVVDKLAPACPELIPAAVKLFPSLTPHHRGVVIASLAKYGPAAKEIVPDLLRVLKDEEGLPPHKDIAETLGAIGPEAKSALPELRKLLDHRDIRVALAAKTAIEKIEAKK